MVSGGIHAIKRSDIGAIVRFIKNTLNRSGCSGLIVGVSGGLDSAVTLKLCADAVGPRRVTAIFMPSAVTPSSDFDLTSSLSRSWGVGHETIGIQPAADAFAEILSLSADDHIGMGNVLSRCRMTVLYSRAREMNCLVVGTSNRSECMMGYFTKFGDGASDMLPLADLYKTQVRQIAEIIGIPQEIIEKVPTAGLWNGQTDEGEFGIAYRDLDIVLNGIDKGKSDGEIAEETGTCIAKVSEVREWVGKTEHKRLPAPHPDITLSDP
ncbi:MAG: NAD+ synthase [Candidatus Methanoplasma sp.]|nr:NAD+ synthase [Candidatus Methanoplasma sp.]